MTQQVIQTKKKTEVFDYKKVSKGIFSPGSTPTGKIFTKNSSGVNSQASTPGPAKSFNKEWSLNTFKPIKNFGPPNNKTASIVSSVQSSTKAGLSSASQTKYAAGNKSSIYSEKTGTKLSSILNPSSAQRSNMPT